MYANGWGVPKDEAKAAQAYQKSCDGGDAAGCYGFGQALRQGKGVPKDEAKALLVYKKSCDAKYAPGCYKHAYMYEEGLGVAKDRGQGRAHLPEVLRPRRLRGLRQDRRRCTKAARAWPRARPRPRSSTRRAAMAGTCAAATSLAGLYEKGVGVSKDEAKAIALYQKACDGGFKDACPKVPGGATAAK